MHITRLKHKIYRINPTKNHYIRFYMKYKCVGVKYYIFYTVYFCFHLMYNYMYTQLTN